MKSIIKNNYKIIIAFILGIIISGTSVYAIEAYIESSKVSYDNKHTEKDNVQDSLDELYERSGIHKEKWIDKELNGADPVLQEPLIPVEITDDGEVYYANENSEWYNYKKKKWANAIILVDNPSNENYRVGDHILEDDIESYFVWIPRYQYKVWNLANTDDYAKAIDGSTLLNSKETATDKNALWRITGNNTRIIDIKFGNVSAIPKMNESEASLNNYYTHPAFTLGDKDLNGIWVGKFETGGTQANDMVVKPNVVSWRNQKVKVFFDAAKDFTSTALDSHMMKNTEWGAVAYLSHSQYGIGNEVNINNAKDFYTGYSAAPGTNQSTIPSESATHDTAATTQPWNTPIGYLASTTGNITGVYDMSGGAWEYMAACIDGNFKDSGFTTETLKQEMDNGYIDKYDSRSAITTYNYRILGDATGEMGPFYSYFEGDGTYYNHSSWYGDCADFVFSARPWFSRGGAWGDSVLAGQFYFSRYTGGANGGIGFRVVLAPAK